jgi:hypothetical protein
MNHEEHGPIELDHDLVSEPSEPKAPHAPTTPSALGLQLDVRMNKKMRPPADPEDPAGDVPERVMEYDTAFLEAVQRNLPRLGLKPGGKATEYRSLRHWNESLSGPGHAPSKFSEKSDQKWADVMKRYGSIFDQATADEDDFIVILEYPTGEQAVIQVRRLSGDSLQR